MPQSPISIPPQDADKLDGKDPSYYVQQPDESSIVDGPDGFQVRKPSEKIVGDFEVDYGDWTKNTNNGVYENVSFTSGAQRGSQAVNFNVADDKATATGEICRNLDLSNFEQIFFYCEPVTTVGDLEMRIDGSTKVQMDKKSTGSWYQFTHDISGLNGIYEVKFIAYDPNSNDYGTARMKIDDVRLRNPIRSLIDSGAGN